MQFNNLGKQWECIRENTLKRIDEIGHEGSYINGKSVSDFEQEFSYTMILCLVLRFQTGLTV